MSAIIARFKSYHLRREMYLERQSMLTSGNAEWGGAAVSRQLAESSQLIR